MSTTDTSPLPTTLDLTGLPPEVVRAVVDLVAAVRRITPSNSADSDGFTQALREHRREQRELTEQKWARYGYPPDNEDTASAVPSPLR